MQNRKRKTYADFFEEQQNPGNTGTDVDSTGNKSKNHARKDRNLSITWWTYEEFFGTVTQQKLDNFFGSFCTYWYVQEEIAPTTGNVHLQGHLYLPSARSPNGVKKEFGIDFVKVKSQKKWFASLNYARKKESRKEGGWVTMHLPPSQQEKKQKSEQDKQAQIQYAKLLQKMKLRPYAWDTYDERLEQPWQRFIFDLGPTEPHKRNIYIPFSWLGDLGKSTIIRHLLDMYEHQVFVINGSTGHITNGLRKQYLTHGFQRFIILDIPKEQGNDIAYGALEALKNGYFYNAFGCDNEMVTFSWPHILIFMNEPPKPWALMEDRLQIYEIDPQNRPAAYHIHESILNRFRTIDQLYESAGLAPPAAPQLQPSAAEVNSGNVGVGSAAPRAESACWDLYLKQ